MSLLSFVLLLGCLENPDNVVFQEQPHDAGYDTATNDTLVDDAQDLDVSNSDSGETDIGNTDSGSEDAADGETLDADVALPCDDCGPGGTCISGRCDHVTQVSTGQDHACAAREGGKVVCWGSNVSRTLGQPESVYASGSPLEVPGLANITSVASGSIFTCALDLDGQVKCWGSNEQFAAAGREVRNEENDILQFLDEPHTIDLGAGRATRISAGLRHACALVERDANPAPVTEAWCWGWSRHGAVNGVGGGDAHSPVQVTLPPGANDLTDISASSQHSCAVASGQVWCWGTNNYGQLDSQVDTTAILPPAKAPIPEGIHQDFVEVSAHDSHTCARRENGSVYCWGRDDFGQALTTQVNVAQISTGRFHTCVRTFDGEVSCFGANGYNRLGTDEVRALTHTVELGEGRSAVYLDSGLSFNCAVLDDGSVKCWGLNEFGQSGNGELPFSATPQELDLEGINHIAAGVAHTCALGASSTYCWGRNESGQLGHDDFTYVGGQSVLPHSGFPPTVLALGAAHSCVGNTQSVECWGSNNAGQLGMVGEEGDLTVSEPVVSPHAIPFTNPVGLSAGARHTCVFSLPTTLNCWGDNSSGQISPPPSATLFATGPGVHSTALATGFGHTCMIAKCRGLLPNTCGDVCVDFNSDNQHCNGCNNPCPENTFCSSGECVAQCPVAQPLCNGRCVDLQVDADHCGGCDTGCDADQMCQAGQCTPGTRSRQAPGVVCWGLNSHGQIGLHHSDPSINNDAPFLHDATDVAAGSSHTCALRSNGSVWCWGRNGSRQLGRGDISLGNHHEPVEVDVEGVVFVSLAVGNHHSCALTDQGEVYCWGRNWFGQTGAPPSLNSLPHKVDGLSNIEEVVAGGFSSCARNSSNQVYCWGSNLHGQLGDVGVPTLRADPVRVQSLPIRDSEFRAASQP